MVCFGVLSSLACAATTPAPAPAAAPASAPAATPVKTTTEDAPPSQADVPRIYIREIRVRGVHALKTPEVQEAVYPYLGPGRTADDVEQARGALEQAYLAKGYQTARVVVPPQQGRGGIVYLQVVETKIGRVRVNGSHYYLPSEIKRKAASLAEGSFPDFHRVTSDVMALNTQADLRVAPAFHPGAEPDTVDVDLNVEDKNPLHGSLELNNRYNPNTTRLRVNGSLSYSNLWQAGNTLGLGCQLAPEKLTDAEVFSGYYIAPVPSVDGLSLMLQASKQDSNVATLGSTSIGRGDAFGLRALVTLPSNQDFSQSLSAGIDYKHELNASSANPTPPIDYFPLSLNYGGLWNGKGFTEFNASLNFALRGVGSRQAVYDVTRAGSDGGFIYFRGDLSHTHDLPEGLQVFAKIQGQVSNEPLVPNEQYSGGGLGTVRGYPEATALGDNGVFGTLELRSPTLIGKPSDKTKEWRFRVFLDAGATALNAAAVGESRSQGLASFGLGSSFRIFSHYNGSLDAGVPLIGFHPLGERSVNVGEIGVTFRSWTDF